MIHPLLIVDDEEDLCISLKKLFSAHGIETDYAVNPAQAFNLIIQNSYSLIISDLKMPSLSGIDLLKQIRCAGRKIPVILISGYASVDNVVEAMKYGALNFYEKPVVFKMLLEDVRRILTEKKSDGSQAAFSQIISESSQMKEKLLIIQKAAPTEAPVILTGPSGTGKELFAEALHNSSKRAGKALIKLNCAALPETLLESELFGVEKGAFTDAHKNRKGKFEAAEGGTLFLDEIGDMNLRTQAKVLRVLQEKEYERLGSNETKKADVRIVAATNMNLQEMIKQGSFREDLYYRLSVICIQIPTLRERMEDVLPLATHFLSLFSQQYGKDINHFSQEVINTFLQHPWPGNVRELKNCLERAVIFCEQSEIQMIDLPGQYQMFKEPENSPIRSLYDNVSREVILGALERAGGNRTRAAEYLQISRKTLYSRMHKLGIE